MKCSDKMLGFLVVYIVLISTRSGEQGIELMLVLIFDYKGCNFEWFMLFNVKGCKVCIGLILVRYLDLKFFGFFFDSSQRQGILGWLGSFNF